MHNIRHIGLPLRRKRAKVVGRCGKLFNCPYGMRARAFPGLQPDPGLVLRYLVDSVAEHGYQRSWPACEQPRTVGQRLSLPIVRALRFVGVLTDYRVTGQIDVCYDFEHNSPRHLPALVRLSYAGEPE